MRSPWVKSECLGLLQHDMFEETLDIDLAAIATEIEQLSDDRSHNTVVQPKRPRAGRPPPTRASSSH